MVGGARLPRRSWAPGSGSATTTSPATRERRADDLNALFADPEVDVVQALQGGFGSAQLIPYLDFDLIAENPKPLVGFSDLTALHVALRQKAGLATIYGNGLMGVGSAGDDDVHDRSGSSRCSAPVVPATGPA